MDRAASNYQSAVGRVEDVYDNRAAPLRRQVRGAKASFTRATQQNDDEAIETLRNRGKRIYNTRVRTLQSRRVDQLRDLDTKFNSGRAAIARMPASS
jgi:hypothetical protein